ncbi:4Fe-4S dicluster domain-containing protein, partial [Desulfonatronospira sp.]|uniref:4Fe-4S dicluster domain-containing protein n=1 Tax=Desulfonatronospira sp. TaxID=1962951 RepID=UPI0025BD4D6A
PVPEYFDDPRQELGLYPHQIVHATILGLNDLVASSRMLWACVGCYQCQEHCPQEIRVTDVLYAHKQAALSVLKAGEE